MYRLRKKCGMPLLGTLLNCRTPSVAPEPPQFLSPHRQKEKLRPGAQGWPGHCKGQRRQVPPPHTTTKGPATPLRVVVAFWEMLSTGTSGFSDEMSVTGANHHFPPMPGTPLLTGPKGFGVSWPEAGPKIPKRKEKAGLGEKEAFHKPNNLPQVLPTLGTTNTRV